MKRVLILVFLSLGCGSTVVVIEPEWREKECEDLNDCSEAVEGDVCATACANTAVHRDFFFEWKERYDAANVGCTPDLPALPDASPTCQTIAVCIDNHCTIDAATF